MSCSRSDAFLAGRGLPWWLPASSVFSTHTATDTPMWVTGVIYAHGYRGLHWNRQGIAEFNAGLFFECHDTLEELCARLVDARVIPYYLHQLDRVAGAAHFEVPVERGLELAKPGGVSALLTTVPLSNSSVMLSMRA